ncbi:MAG: alpha/beta hydrolase [Clostridia bacterium]|nr:alpha/beta hydrolase [Clostridia bacterium]
MGKFAKTALKAAAGAGAFYLASGAIVYECVLDIPLLMKIKGSGVFKKKNEEEFWDKCEIRKQANEWYEKNEPEDTAIFSRLGRNMKGKVFEPVNGGHNWAIVIHGYSSCTAAMALYAQTYYKKGFGIVMPHMVGHGPDTVRHCSMGYYDRFMILDWIDYIIDRDPEAKIVIHGESMGSATTMLVTGEPLPSNVLCAVADCGYTSCWDEYASQMKEMFHLPNFPFLYAANTISKLTGNFDFKKCSPLEAVKHSNTPTLFVHGEADKFVPYEMCKPLYEACSAPEKRMLSVPNAFHASAIYFDYDKYKQTLEEFVGKYFDDFFDKI